MCCSLFLLVALILFYVFSCSGVGHICWLLCHYIMILSLFTIFKVYFIWYAYSYPCLLGELQFVWNIFTHPFTFSLRVSLKRKWVSYTQCIIGPCFCCLCIQSAILWLLTAEFNLLIRFKIIIDSKDSALPFCSLFLVFYPFSFVLMFLCLVSICFDFFVMFFCVITGFPWWILQGLHKMS